MGLPYVPPTLCAHAHCPNSLGTHMNVVSNPLFPFPCSNSCIKCNTLYPLPRGATTWRCRSCGHFNSTNDDGSFMLCTVS
ncbi:hypothetical protein T492DRAFT_991904 [Pavlovales sp. CCMP2436]|nr:hypothetical protein T492DRAFT_991904 [Pavlovales sp. CCMP2436]